MYNGEPSRGCRPQLPHNRGTSTLNDAVMASEGVESKVFRTACSNGIKLPEVEVVNSFYHDWCFGSVGGGSLYLLGGYVDWCITVNCNFILTNTLSKPAKY